MTRHHDALGGGASELERSLLESAKLDAPSPAAKHRTMAAVGVGTAVGLGGAQAAAAGTSATVLALKWLAVGLFGGALTAGAVTGFVAEPAPERSPLSSSEPAGRSQAPAPELDPPRAAPVAEPPEEPAPPKTRALRGSPTGSATAGPTLSEQVRSLDRVRARLASGSSERALAELDEHQTKYATGALAVEGRVLRIEALLAAGRRAEAAAAAERFLAVHPPTPHTRKVRSLLERARGGD